MCDDDDDGRERARLPFNIAQIWLGLKKAEDRLVVRDAIHRARPPLWTTVCSDREGWGWTFVQSRSLAASSWPQSAQMLTRALSSAVLIAGLLLSVPAEAAFDYDNKTTHMTFEHAVRVPGATLPAGHYLFSVGTVPQPRTGV